MTDSTHRHHKRHLSGLLTLITLPRLGRCVTGLRVFYSATHPLLSPLSKSLLGVCAPLPSKITCNQHSPAEGGQKNTDHIPIAQRGVQACQLPHGSSIDQEALLLWLSIWILGGGQAVVFSTLTLKLTALGYASSLTSVYTKKPENAMTGEGLSRISGRRAGLFRKAPSPRLGGDSGPNSLFGPPSGTRATSSGQNF